MAVDIDSLQIEIEATSSDAAAKIDALATALTNLKAAAKGGAGLTTVSKQMQALASAAASLNNTGIGKLRKIAPALNSLSSIQKSSGLNSTVNALKKLPEISTALNKADLGKFAQQMNQVASAMRPLATEMQKVSNGFSAFPIRIQKIIQSNTGLSASNNKAAKSFGVLGTGISSTTAKLGIYYLAFQRVANMASDWVKSANDYIENVNLFQVSMGEFYDEAFAYAELLNDRLGIDPSEWMRAQGVFMSMANGFGLARQQAYDLSEGLTELSYDLSSLYNEDVSESILRLQSALSGEIEPIRRLGISISQATLQEYALAHGIDESVISMTEQEKALLRSLVLMESAGRIGAIGDFAKTLESPANALRVLRQQITQLGRAIGTALLPIIIQIIPWVQAFVEVLTDAIRALATFLGFTMPEWETSDWATGITDGASDAEDAIGGATSAAKEMKKALLGIDELTILEPSNAGGSGGVSGGSGWASDLEIPNIWDKNAILEIQTKADELKKVLEEVLYDYVLPIGTALAAWKIAGLIGNLKTATGLLGGMKSMIAGGIIAYLELQLAIGAFGDFFSEGGEIWDLVNGALVVALGSGLLYAVFGGPGIILGLGIGLVAMIVSLTSAISSGLDYNGVKASIGTSLIAGLGGAIGFLVTKTPQGAFIGFSLATALQLNLNSISAHISGQISKGTEKSIFTILQAAFSSGLAGAGIGFVIGGPAGAAIGFVVGAALSIVGQNVAIDFGNWYKETSRIVDGIEVLDNSISEATKNSVDPFLEQMRDLDDSMANLEFRGTVIDDSVIAGVQEKVDTIVATITNGLDSSKNDVLSTLEPLAGILGSEKYNEILVANQNYYMQAKEAVAAGEAEISAIMQEAAIQNRALTETEWTEITGIQAEMLDLGVSNLSETQIEYETIMRNLKDNAAHISLEQASEIIKNAQATRDETISAAETQYSTVLLEAQKMLDTGVINSEQYQAIVDAAKNAKDSTIADATEQYESIYDTASTKLGDLSRYIDENTGEIKSIWQVFWDDVGLKWNNFWDSIENGWQDFKKSFKSGWNEFWTTGLGGAVVGGINGIISTVETGLNWIIEKINSLSFTTPDWLPFGLGGKRFGLDIPKITLGRVSMPTFAFGGFPEHGEMFIAREQGPELVGRIGNRTAVANNDQIVEGVAAGVTSANNGVINAIYAMAQQIIAAIEENGGDVYLDGDKVGKQVTAYQNRQNRMYGKTLQRI